MVCALGLFWDNDKGHESPGVLDSARLCPVSKGANAAPGEGHWGWAWLQISRLVPAGSGDPELNQSDERKSHKTTMEGRQTGLFCQGDKEGALTKCFLWIPDQ